MKVHEAIQILETMPAGADVNFMQLELAYERNGKMKKDEIEKYLACNAVKARGFENFLKPCNYVCAIYVNNPRSYRMNFNEAFEYAYVDCGSYFDVYKLKAKTVELRVEAGNDAG